MADNVTLPATGTGTADIVVATDLISGAQYQRAKVNWGADGTTQDADTATGKGLPVQVVPGTLGGNLNAHVISAGSTNATIVKASPGQLYSVVIFNNASTPLYVKFHNTSGSPTAGTGVVKTFGVQAGMLLFWQSTQGMTFSTGIGMTTVTGIADNDANAVALNDLSIDAEYK